MSPFDRARTDWAGIVHRLLQPRIACVVPSLTELLFALNLGPHVVARTGFCVHPRDSVKWVPKVGGTKDVDLDKLRAQRPTHLIVNVDENRLETVDAARAFVSQVIVTHPCAPEDNPRLYALLGSIFGREPEAASLGAQFTDALRELDTAVLALPRERVLYLIWKKPWMTVARGTYIATTLARAGWDTVVDDERETADARYPQLAGDDPLWRAADRILVSSEPYAFRDRDAHELEATYAKPAHLIDGEMTSWYGPRAIAGMRYLARIRAELAASPRR